MESPKGFDHEDSSLIMNFEFFFFNQNMKLFKKKIVFLKR